ncbi:hypothetical protein AK830_g7860 [Neonectria ditissima]|uniref:Zn(2)-C6 fungal-type domain-containing protein n=1 Tax=Neonectria ditissima TaxID=78410 RepID=A0A0N8H6D8_9HYPO|nr:hypothetical protein AK830_g7860 [Neonectria ditissima]
MAANRHFPASAPEPAVSNAVPPRADVDAGAGADTDTTGRLRRPHRKSRRGCRPCKAKRIKVGWILSHPLRSCDESQPACGSCTRKNIPCNYFETFRPAVKPKQRIKILPIQRTSSKDVAVVARHPQPQRKREPPRQSIIAPAEVTIHLPGPVKVATPSEGLLDLRLLHHYHKMASQSPRAQNAWSFWIIEMAVQSPGVMDAILGFSAFHLRRLGNTDFSVREASHKYMVKAIRSHTEQLQSGINEDNAAPMIASCALILFHTSVNHNYLSNSNGYQVPLHWFRPFQTAGNFFGAVWPWVQESCIGKRLRGQMQFATEVASDRSPRSFDFLLQDMDPDLSMDKETISAYTLAVSHLTYIYGNPQYRKLLQFPALVTPRFTQLLEAKDPRTLAIVGYFFLLVKLGQLLWWVDGTADVEFAAVMSFLPKKWWPVMSWAIDVFEWSSP